MRKIVSLFAALALVLALGGCGGGKRVPRRKTVDSEQRQFVQPAEGDIIAIFETSLGEIRAVLYPDAAPMAVNNFAGLARTGYYDGTVIWRAEYGFVVQGGDADGTGSGGGTIWSNNPYPLEASDSLRHYAGALCAAFSAQGGTGQFYFVQALPDSVDKTLQSQLAEAGYPEEQVAAYKAAGGLPYLDNTDTVFGQVYQGMEVVDAIACADTVRTEGGTDTFRPVEDIVISHITVTTYQAGE